MPKVMMVGTSESSGGGISSVIRLIKKMPVWEKYSCYWLGTQIQRGLLWKLWYAVKAAIVAPLIMWRYDIVHFHMVPGITLLIQLPELLVAKLYGKKVIMEVHVGNQLVPYANDKFFNGGLNRPILSCCLHISGGNCLKNCMQRCKDRLTFFIMLVRWFRLFLLNKKRNKSFLLVQFMTTRHQTCY